MPHLPDATPPPPYQQQQQQQTPQSAPHRQQQAQQQQQQQKQSVKHQGDSASNKSQDSGIDSIEKPGTNLWMKLSNFDKITFAKNYSFFMDTKYDTTSK